MPASSRADCVVGTLQAPICSIDVVKGRGNHSIEFLKVALSNETLDISLTNIELTVFGQGNRSDIQ